MTFLSRSAARSSTRREFLTTTTLAMAGTVLGARQLSAGVPVQLPTDSPRSAADFLSNTSNQLSPPDLRALATRAVDAATSAGASYADVRVAIRHFLVAEWGRVLLYTHCTYGVRALVDGVWGFAYGRTSTTDAVTQCAQQAVAAGRVSARLSRTGTRVDATTDASWTPPPVVTGEWQTPMVVDPFAVPVQQHAEVQFALLNTINRVPEARGHGGGIDAQWMQEIRVFAASTGSLVTQQLRRAMPTGYVYTGYGNNQVGGRVPSLRWASAGYEAITAPNLAEDFKVATEEAAAFARLPMRPLDVGRYPIVFDGYVMSNLLVNVIGPSLELDRALGEEADASGTSLFTPDLLGTTIASPLVTVTGHRALPSVTAVQWDDEGAVPREHTVIRDGVLVDYHTDGHTTPALHTWHQQHGTPHGSNGCAVADEAEHMVLIRPPHLTMTPSATPLSLADLCKEMQRGVVVINHGWITTDQQRSSGSLSSWDGLYEVSRGQIVSRLLDTGLQFNTRPFLKAITAVGDHTTVRQQDVSLAKGITWSEAAQSATAPAALFKEINVISTQRA